jgi:hypothetical protein
MGLKELAKKASGIFFEDVGNTLDQTQDSGGLDPDLLKKLQGNSSITLDELNKQLGGTTQPTVAVDQSVIQPSQAPVNKPPAAPIVNGNVVDFSPIYNEAQIPTAPLSAEEFLKMLADLGEDIPLTAKRTMAGTMLKALAKNTPGLTSVTIVNDALAKIKALAAYNDGVKTQLDSFVADREKAIAEAQARIESEKKAMETAKQRVAQITTWCEDEGNVLDDVLEFFSSDTGASRLATEEPVLKV